MTDYESDPPPFDLNEVLELWADLVADDADPSSFPEPVYTLQERAALLDVHQAWLQFCEATPTFITDDLAARALPEWGVLLACTRTARATLESRGRLPED
ncbi:hypothetical protein [Chitinolyticbacter meiyuanensis]|uniref:hypothetical protein n=1 Tax=Chitinolyticbacter meiyuanensis TaxID=682798 RepID=UPI0011E5F1D7|nr:hypothetical protein [Chitinolyticbacter meiyuanensis]